MSDFIPSTSQVRSAYIRATKDALIASAVVHAEEFDRWLTQLLADVWDAGFDAGDGTPQGENPYRREPAS